MFHSYLSITRGYLLFIHKIRGRFGRFKWGRYDREKWVRKSSPRSTGLMFFTHEIHGNFWAIHLSGCCSLEQLNLNGWHIT